MIKRAAFVGSKTIFTTASLIAALSGCSVEPAEFEDAEQEVAVNGGRAYELKAPLLANKCIDVSDNSPNDGANVQLWSCNGSSAQRWVAEYVSWPYFRLKHSGTNQCLNRDARADRSTFGNVQQWTCGWGDEFLWKFEWLSNGYQRVRSKYDDKCLDVAWGSSADGANVQTYWCRDSDNSAQSFNPSRGLGIVFSEQQFNDTFPNRSWLYTYSAMLDAAETYPEFVDHSNWDVRRREAAAFLANLSWESDWLRATKEYDTSNYGEYCDWSKSYGCPAGSDQYYGRGPIQLSWNYNYKAAGDALGIDLLNNPNWVATDSTIAMKTALWFWNSQSGANWAGNRTAHNVMTCSGVSQPCGFGETIRTINGGLECGRSNPRPRAVEERVARYKQFCDMFGVSYGSNLYCD